MKAAVCIAAISALLAVHFQSPAENVRQEAGQGRSYAKAAGISFCFNEFSASYRTAVKEDELLKLSLNIDMAGVIPGCCDAPGISAGITYQYVFSGKDYPSGESIRFFAGPGADVGYLRDSGGRYGCMVAVTGCVGLEYLFCVPVSISLTVEPCLGIHVRKDGNDLMAGLYKAGLVYSLYPHLGLKYLF